MTVKKAVMTLDQAGTLFLEKQLTQMLSKSLTIKYADLNFRRIFPINNELSPAVETIEMKVYDSVGLAKIISSYAQDLPRSDVSAEKLTFKIVSVGTSMGFSVLEILQAQAVGEPLEQRKSNACRKATEERMHRIAWYGDEESGMPGFLSNPNVPISNVVGGTWLSGKAPDAILNDINTIFTVQDEITNQIESAKVLMLPPAQYNYIANTRLSADNNTTIMEYLIQKSIWIDSAANIVKVRELRGIGSGGTDVMCIYDPNPEKLEMYISMELTFLDPQPNNLEMKIPAWARCGGVHIYYPMSVSRAEGI